MRLQCLTQEPPDWTALLSQRLHDGQHPLDESAPSFADGAEALLAPEHALADCTLRSIIRGLDAVVAQECPQRGLQRQELTTQCLGLGAARSAAALQQLTQP